MGLEEALARTPTGERPRFDTSRGSLVGSRCTGCSTTVWPGRAVCHRCGSWDVEDIAFAGTASLLTFTEVHVARPGLEAPYTLGQVRVDEGGPLLFGRVRGLTEAVRLPCPVRIVVSGTGSGKPTYWFEPAA
ncbi:Zn-ribbon domain-containing OB-fold protein [Streptomyces albidus (ex Kaewkla and Franco 2022)]|uniref:Zn-ribbon domain-containing OB-fold protein n=1 Tax=Streptomyces albidus (ex Kaewkla and Franco 2022) TaxID=722709 RepID=UPI0015EE3A00|nr:OB-fold domain-containing protein [Streptomyces albidus (ex Kaewkla and Franco 2022)]